MVQLSEKPRAESGGKFPHLAATFMQNSEFADLELSYCYKVLNRICDVVVAAITIICLFPILIFVSVAIRIEDRGPVLYRQQRVGKHGKLFTFYKFRSMRIDADQQRNTILHLKEADGAAFKMKEDPRRTRVGSLIRKLSIDETPQLLLVLIGHMSIVGPRPHLPEEVETYSGDEWKRLAIKPGLLCFREVRGRSEISFDQWLKSDLEYVSSKCFLVDLQIMLMAIPAVITCRGAY